MQNLSQKFKQSSIVFKKAGILSENLKTLTSSNYPTVQYFLLKLCILFFTYQCLTKGCVEFFKFHLDLELFTKELKKTGFYTLVLTLLSRTQDLNKIKKSHTPFCRHW